MLTREVIGQKLQRLRLEKFGDNIRHFERQSGVSRGSVEKVEKLEGFPSLPVLEKWLIACRVSFAHFFEEYEPFAESAMPIGGYKRQHKRHHDELELVLNTIGPDHSATIATLKLEYEKARDSKKKTPDNPSPHPGPNASDPN